MCDNKNTIYCGLIFALTAIFTSIVLPKYPNNILLKLSDSLEKRLNKYDFFKYLNQYVLLDFLLRNMKIKSKNYKNINF